MMVASRTRLPAWIWSLPLFLYRQRNQCFSIATRYHVWEYLQQHPQVKLDWMELKKQLSQFEGNDEKVEIFGLLDQFLQK
jgi:hypothetical protein